MKIKWSDSDGREFGITCISGEFSYSMVSGDRIEYEPSYSSNAGKIRKVGGLTVEYEPSYSSNTGKIRSTRGFFLLVQENHQLDLLDALRLQLENQTKKTIAFQNLIGLNNCSKLH